MADSVVITLTAVDQTSEVAAAVASSLDDLGAAAASASSPLEELSSSSASTVDDLQGMSSAAAEASGSLEDIGSGAASGLQDVSAAATDASDGIGEVSDAAGEASGSLGEMGEAGEAAGTKVGEGAEEGGGNLENMLSVVEAISPALIEAFSVGALVEFGASILESAENFEILSNKTGVSITYLEQLKPVADTSGTSIDALATAIFRMGTNIDQGTTKTVTGLNQLAAATGNQSLQWSTLVASGTSTEDMFKEITDALHSMSDQQEANTIGTEIFGRQYMNMAAAVHDGSLKAAADQKVSSDAQVEALAKQKQALTNLEDEIENKAIGVLGTMAAVFTSSASAIDKQRVALALDEGPISAIEALWGAGKATLASMPPPPKVMTQAPTATKPTEDFVATLKQAKDAVAALSASQLAQISADIQLHNSTTQIATDFHLSSAAIDLVKTKLADQAKAESQAEAATKAHAAAVKADAEYQTDYGEAVMGTLPQEDAIIKLLNEHYLSTKQITEELPVTETAIKAVQAAEKARVEEEKVGDAQLLQGAKDFIAAMKEEEALEVARYGDITKISTALTDMGDKGTLAFPGMTAGAKELTTALAAQEKQLVQNFSSFTNWDKDAKLVEGDLSSLASATTGTFSTVVGDIGKGAKAVQSFGDAIGQIESGNLLAGITGIATGVIGLASDLWNSVFGLNATQTALQNLGVTVQNQLFGDPWFASQTEELKELQGQVPLTEATLDDLFQGIDAGGQQATEALSTLGSLLPEIETNATEATATSEDLFTTYKAGGASATTAMTDLNTMVTDFQSQASSTSGVWSNAFQTLIQQSQQLGVNVSGITSALTTQVNNATTGLNDAFGVVNSAYTAMAADQKTLADSSSTSTDIQTATADLLTQQQILAAIQPTTQAAATGLADAAVATVDANMKMGDSFVDAVKAAEPSIQGLQQQLTATGFSGGAAFSLLSQEVSLATGAVSGPALTAVEGMTSAVTGLANAGGLTQSSFAGLEGSIGTTFKSLTAQGASSQAVLAALQPDLQTAWQLEQQYGYTADSVTQSLINQGVQSGLVGEQQKSSTQQMIDALNNMSSDLDILVGKIQGLGGAAQSAASVMNDAFSTVKNPNVSLTYTAPSPTSATPTSSTSGPPGAVDTSYTPPALGTGGLVSQKTLAWVAESGPEAVVPISASNGAGIGPLPGYAPSAPAGPVTITFNVNPIVNVNGTTDPEATAAAVVDAVVGSGQLRSALANLAVAPVLSSRGLLVQPSRAVAP